MTHRIYIQAGTDVIQFEDDRGALSMPTRCRARLRTGLAGSAVEIVSEGGRDAETVELFPPTAQPLQGYSRFQVLTAVLADGLAQLVQRRPPVSRTPPDIAVVVTPELITRLAGYHEEILLAALERVGVRHVLFVDGEVERPAWSWRPGSQG